MQKSFEEISVSTTTVIVKTNLSLNLQWLYSISSTIQGDVFFKTSKGLQEHLSRLEISIGSIISVQYQDNCKGFKVKRRRTKYFRNALSIVLYVGKLLLKYLHEVKFKSLGAHPRSTRSNAFVLYGNWYRHTLVPPKRIYSIPSAL
jgi:hypothetical protein